MKPTSTERGAALVEFAIVLPLLILLVFGIIDFGRVSTMQINLNEAVQEGSIYGATHPADHTTIKKRVAQNMTNPPIGVDDVFVICSLSKRKLTVSAVIDVDYWTPVIPGSITLSSDVTADVLVSADCNP
jgi:Flp pilus assembly protein TadG